MPESTDNGESNVIKELPQEEENQSSQQSKSHDGGNEERKYEIDGSDDEDGQNFYQLSDGLKSQQQSSEMRNPALSSQKNTLKVEDIFDTAETFGTQPIILNSY